MAMRAVASEPRLLAATLFRGREELRAAVVARVVGIAGLDAGWREALRREAATPIEAGGPEVDLEDSIDTNGALAPSYYLFRREPWPAGLARVRLDAAAARRITVPSAAVLALSMPEAFPADHCLPAAGAD